MLQDMRGGKNFQTSEAPSLDSLLPSPSFTTYRLSDFVSPMILHAHASDGSLKRLLNEPLSAYMTKALQVGLGQLRSGRRLPYNAHSRITTEIWFSLQKLDRTKLVSCHKTQSGRQD